MSKAFISEAARMLGKKSAAKRKGNTEYYSKLGKKSGISRRKKKGGKK